jgi:Lhr-like helicase
MSVPFYATVVGTNIFAMFLGFLYIKGYSVEYGKHGFNYEKEKLERVESEFYNDQYDKTVETYSKLKPLGQKNLDIIEDFHVLALCDADNRNKLFNKALKIEKMYNKAFSETQQKELLKLYSYLSYKPTSDDNKNAEQLLDLLDAIAPLSEQLFEIYYNKYFDSVEQLNTDLKTYHEELSKYLKRKNKISKLARKDAIFEVDNDLVVPNQ